MTNSVIPYAAPEYEVEAFNCPHCNAFANMRWARTRADWFIAAGSTEVGFVELARCMHCDQWSIWAEEEQIYPKIIPVESPNIDLPEEVRADYIEAASILQDSPRGAAALMRLAIQKLCDSLVEGKADLNKKIGKLVENGLDKRVQKALDAVRVIGNEAVHPGQIDLNDSPETAHQLFRLVNLIGRRMITEPAEVDAIYDALPEDKKDAIASRDSA